MKNYNELPPLGRNLQDADLFPLWDSIGAATKSITNKNRLSSVRFTDVIDWDILGLDANPNPTVLLSNSNFWIVTGNPVLSINIDITNIKNSIGFISVNHADTITSIVSSTGTIKWLEPGPPIWHAGQAWIELTVLDNGFIILQAENIAL